MSGGLPWFVAEEDGVVLGFAYAAPFNERAAYRWSVATSVYLDVAACRRGVGSALYTALFDLLQALGYITAYAGIALPNPASVALHERFGFTPVGVFRDAGFKLGEWHDVGWWQRPLAPAPTPPPLQAPPREHPPGPGVGTAAG